MSVTPQYDRSYTIPAILDLSNLKPEEASEFLESIAEFSPTMVQYPSEHALDIAKELAAAGWPGLARPMPLEISSQEALQIFARSLLRFNTHGYVRKEPDASRINKKVESTADFARIVDDLTTQQDKITLSNIFKTAELKSSVYYSLRSTDVNRCISRSVIVVQRAKTKNQIEERKNLVTRLIKDAIEGAEAEERSKYNKPQTSNFQYR